MKKLKELLEERAAKLKAAQAITTLAETEKRELKPDEEKQYDDLVAEMRALEIKIDRAREMERLEGEEAARSGQRLTNTHNTQEARDLEKYSLTKALRSTLPGGKPLDGIELEMHQEAVRETRNSNTEMPETGVGVPSMLQRRDNTITKPTQPQDGSAVREPDTVRPVIDLLRPRSVLRALGATFLTGLTGDVNMSALSGGAVSTWKDEIDELDKSNQTFSTAKMSPRRLGTFAIRSLQFLTQTSDSVNQLLTRDLERSVMQALEVAAINGSGTNNQPLGLLNNPNVLQLALGPNGGALTYDQLVALEILLEDNNVSMDSAGYLINPTTKGKLKTTRTDPGSGLFVMPSNTELNGYPVQSTANVPKNLTKGSGTNLSAGIFGNWSDLLIGQWGSIFLTTDPYTMATSGRVRVIMQGFYDTLPQQPKAFAVVKDISNA